MEPFSGINSLANVVAMTGIAAAKTVVDTANNAAGLQQFADNQVLRGMVQQRGANNLVTIQTDQGTLKIQTDILLKRGAEVALKMESRQGEMFARLISVDGMSLAKYVEQLQGVQAQVDMDAIASEANFLRPAMVTASASAQSALPDALTSLLRGVFLSSPQPETTRLAQMPAAMQTALLQAQTGTSLQVRIVSIMVPSADGAGFTPLSKMPVVNGDMSLPTPSGTAPVTTSYLTAAQKLTADVSVQAALQNQQAAKAVLPEQALPVPSAPTTPASTTAQTSQATMPAVTARMEGLSPNHTYQPVSPSLSAPPSALTASSGATLPTQSAVQVTAQQPTPPPAGATPAPQHAMVGSLVATGGSVAVSPLPAATTTTEALTFQAQVMQSSNPRELVLHHPELGSFKLFVTAPLPKGSVLTFELMQATQVRGQGMMPEPARMEAARYEAIQEITELESLEHVPHPASAPRTLPPVHILPRVGVNMTTEIMFLFAALRGGDIRRWLGEENISRLSSGNAKELLSQLTQEFGAMKAPPAADQRDGQWHHVMIPLYAEEKVQPVQYFFKRSRHAVENGQHKDTDHFMVEIDLTHLGRMQLDGLVQKQPQSYQCDMIIRTEQLWETEIEQGIRAIFLQAQEIGGFQGSIQFRKGNDALLPLPIDNDSKDASNRRYLMV